MLHLPVWEDVDEIEAQPEARSSNPHHISAAVKKRLKYDELWLMGGVDSKSRKKRWSALHACIVGWAELVAIGGHRYGCSSGSALSSSGRSQANASARRAVQMPEPVFDPTAYRGNSSSSSSKKYAFGSSLSLSNSAPSKSGRGSSCSLRSQLMDIYSDSAQSVCDHKRTLTLLLQV